jgi:DNA replication protein DnaC
VRNSSSPPPASLIITPPPEMPEPRVPLTVERLNESTRHLFERERELSLINKALSEARAGSGALISVDGEPGIGKSSLVSVARREATDAGMLVLFAAADEVTSASEFGTVVKLFTPVLDRLSASRRRSVFSGRASVN